MDQLKLLRPLGRQALLYGRSSLWPHAFPSYAKVEGWWPHFRVHFSDQLEPGYNRVTTQRSGKGFSVSVAAVSRGFPIMIGPADNTAAWSRVDAMTFEFDYHRHLQWQKENSQRLDEREQLRTRAAECVMTLSILCGDYFQRFGAPLEPEIGIEFTDEPLSAPEVTEFNLSHSLIQQAVLNGLPAGNKWNVLLEQVIRCVPVHDLHHNPPNLPFTCYKLGEQQGRGMRYLPDLDLSLQWRSADRSWKIIAALVQHFGLSIEIIVTRPPQMTNGGQRARLLANAEGQSITLLGAEPSAQLAFPTLARATTAKLSQG